MSSAVSDKTGNSQHLQEHLHEDGRIMESSLTAHSMEIKSIHAFGFHYRRNGKNECCIVSNSSCGLFGFGRIALAVWSHFPN